MLSLKNAGQSLIIPTHDGSGQATHPSIIDFFTEHGITLWGGYRYWMCMTPYPNSDDAHEDPNIIVSNDMVNWVVPAGITNPLDDAPGTALGSFHSDCDMVYNPDTNEIWVYYRLMDYNVTPNIMYIKLIKISENMQTTQSQIVRTEEFATYTHKMRSFSIWREASDKWHIFGQGGERPFGIYHALATSGTDFNNLVFTRCLDNNSDPINALNYEPWHFSCKPDYNNLKIKFLLACIVKDHASISNSGYLLYAESPMANPTLLSTPIANPILNRGVSWDNSLIYRPTFILHDKDVWDVFYAGRSGAGVWGIGYTQYSAYTWQLIEKYYTKKNDVITEVTKLSTKNGLWKNAEMAFVKKIRLE